MELRLVRHAVVDSTNERAFAALAGGSARHGDVHVAEGQSAGRGRLGRRWESPAGEGLYLSLILLPGRAAAQALHPAALTMAAGLAVLEAVRALGTREARLKWPNDVVVPVGTREAKLAGILVESRGLDPARPHAVVGVGLNVLQREFPAELCAQRAVTSLALLGPAISRERALEAVLGRLRPRMDEACSEPATIARDYARDTGLVGRTVRVSLGTGAVRGRLRALTLDGLELQRAGAPEDGGARIALEHALAVELDESEADPARALETDG